MLWFIIIVTIIIIQLGVFLTEICTTADVGMTTLLRGIVQM